MPRRQQQRLDRHVERAVDANRARDLADAEAHRLGQIAIRRIDFANAAHQEAVRAHPRAKRAVGEDRQLRRGVVTVDVGGGIGFGKAQPLRFGDRFVERQVALLEPRHDEVAASR